MSCSSLCPSYSSLRLNTKKDKTRHYKAMRDNTSTQTRHNTQHNTTQHKENKITVGVEVSTGISADDTWRKCELRNETKQDKDNHKKRGGKTRQPHDKARQGNKSQGRTTRRGKGKRLITSTQHDTTHNTTQHNTTQHNTTQHNTIQHNTTQHQHKTTYHHPLI
jgi:hypothetical protein